MFSGRYRSLGWLSHSPFAAPRCGTPWVFWKIRAEIRPQKTRLCGTNRKRSTTKIPAVAVVAMVVAVVVAVVVAMVVTVVVAAVEVLGLHFPN